MRVSGAVPCQLIEQFIEGGQITSNEPIPPGNIQPSSLDLRLGALGYRVRATFLPRAHETIEDALKHYQIEKIDLTSPTLLQLNQTYVIELQESLALPTQVHAYTNNKSTSGRTNIWARCLVDGLPRFDRIPEGYTGKLWIMVTPRSWNVRVQTGVTLNQARFLVGDNRLSDLELELMHGRLGLVYDAHGVPIKPELDKGILLTADLSKAVVGYSAINTDLEVDLTSGLPHLAEDFFEPVYSTNGEVCLERGKFYIMSTSEFLRVPAHFAVEMVAYDIHSGEFRSHYAGFFDPGFGYGRDGEVLGTPAVLEVDPHEDVIIRHGQPICKMVYEYLLKDPERLYGVDLPSHYMHQRGPQLGRYFSAPKKA